MQKRAGIARAMALDPEILFLDEPSAGLDPVTSRRLDELILALARGLGATVVVVTHELESLLRDRRRRRVPRRRDAHGHRARRAARDARALRLEKVQAFFRRDRRAEAQTESRS
jgi:phospholipid/cholesterol/gamma-HCH transport system ATP-binding protein